MANLLRTSLALATVAILGQAPSVIPAESFPPHLDMSPEQVADTARRLRAELAKLEAELLSPYPSAHPTAGTELGK